MLGVVFPCVLVYVLCMCYANMRPSCVLHVCTSIVYDVSVTVCLRAQERVCVAYDMCATFSICPCVCVRSARVCVVFVCGMCS